ncbi:hypothetical protein FA95DRAFT_1563662 [Auriscalpium vulgare]|uniref:Uncharacterized protein n=1 Tax=Auriscalpium vulgare TaxID=40419 RepID=A0ACB8RGD8_9AGAM|nr:hypothetical protein FA95DRAFT_1563662 [Auriscalpium vulgare]
MPQAFALVQQIVCTVTPAVYRVLGCQLREAIVRAVEAESAKPRPLARSVCLCAVSTTRRNSAAPAESALTGHLVASALSLTPS